MPDATLRQLEYFIAAVEEGSVTAAAQRLHLSQSALSMALGSWSAPRRASAGSASPRSAPTRIGEQVLADARRLLVDLVDLQTSARESQFGLTGASHGGLLQHPFPDGAAAGPQRVRCAVPQSGPHLHRRPTRRLIENLRNGTLDLALLYDYGSDLSAPTATTWRPNQLLPHRRTCYWPKIIRWASRTPWHCRQLVDQPMILFSLSLPEGTASCPCSNPKGLEPRVR